MHYIRFKLNQLYIGQTTIIRLYEPG